MRRGGQRPGAGRKRAITDPALIVMIAADYESQRNQLAQDNAADTIAHHKLSDKLAKATGQAPPPQQFGARSLESVGG